MLLELGRGGMGTVYLARLVGAGGFERLVAIKRAHAPAMGQGLTFERFMREARLAASIHHANVVGTHQIGEDADGPYLACEYVEGEALSGLIERGARAEPIPAPVALRIVLDALAGLHAAHETLDSAGRPLGILHRDVSIENLLVGRDGVTRLTDFGIAKSAVGPGLTEAGTIHGKLLYLTPEYIEGEPSTRSDDTYAMGVTLWIALAGAFPYRSRDNTALVQEVLQQAIPGLGVVGVRVGPMLEACLARAVSRTPSERFQTARGMLDALEAVSAQETRAARHIDVAEFVERVAGIRLAARRSKIQLLGAGLIAPVVAPSLAQTAVGSGAAAAPAGAAVLLDTQPRAVSAPNARTLGLSPRTWLGVAGAGLGAGLLALIVKLSSGDGAGELPTSPAAPVAAPHVEPAAPPPPLRSSGTEQGRVSVEPLHAADAGASPRDTADAGAARGARTGNSVRTPRPRPGDARPPRPATPGSQPGLDIATDNPYR